MKNNNWIYTGIILLIAFVISSCGDEPVEAEDLTDETEFILPEMNDVPEVTKIYKDQIIFDNVNLKSWNYNVIVPDSFVENQDTEYPVLYILHGLGPNYSSTTVDLKIQKKLNYCLYNGLLPEIIVVIPDGGETYWVDGYQDNIKYETFFFNTFIPQVENRFRIDQSKKRYITGYSMGGYGAAHYAFGHPELFAYCYSMSGSLEGRGDMNTPSILETIKSDPGREFPAFTMDIGNHDNMFKDANLRIHEQLLELGIEHEFICREGEHDWDFWHEGLYSCMVKIGELSR